jgi:glycosyltransferase involved in cell wall biosynthesis
VLTLLNRILMRVILVAEHASVDFGGEAALPCHYFRVLCSRDVDVTLIVHERSKPFLLKSFPDDQARIRYVKNSGVHRSIFYCQELLPKRLGDMTLGLVLRMWTQFLQKRLIKQIISSNFNNVIVHQVIPVSPKEPSLIFGLGVPVVFGPLNGGMYYPKGFENYEGRLSLLTIDIGRLISKLVNWLLPGKRKANVIMVANQRTQKVLPSGLQGRVCKIVENGVDLSVWKAPSVVREKSRPSFVYVGRLVDWKAVDVLLDAFFKACDAVGEMELHIIGDGVQREFLETKVAENQLNKGIITFEGWLSQLEITSFLSGADALVLPSLYECGGAVILEAMASSVAVIATDWGGPADYIDESCGILVKPTSRQDLVAGFASAMTYLAQSPDVSSEMGSNGRIKVEQLYDWEKKVDEVISIYKQEMTGV